jgi:hypothetical protein
LLPPWTRALPKAATGLDDHPAIKREWQWSVLRSPLFVPMSALGHKQTFALQNVMSAFPPKADMCGAVAHVCFGQ